MVTVGARPNENSKTFERKLMGVRSPLPGTIQNQALVRLAECVRHAHGSKLCQFCISAISRMERRLAAKSFRSGCPGSLQVPASLTETAQVEARGSEVVSQRGRLKDCAWVDRLPRRALGRETGPPTLARRWQAHI